jgi:hypothetical protein
MALLCLSACVSTPSSERRRWKRRRTRRREGDRDGAWGGRSRGERSAARADGWGGAGRRIATAIANGEYGEWMPQSNTDYHGFHDAIRPERGKQAFFFIQTYPFVLLKLAQAFFLPNIPFCFIEISTGVFLPNIPFCFIKISIYTDHFVLILYSFLKST